MSPRPQPSPPDPSQPIRLASGRRLGKYRLLGRLGDGGHCQVWKARDTLEGIEVALKIPAPGRSGGRATLIQEIRLLRRLRHPHIQPVKNADFIAGHLVVAMELATETLDQRMRRRFSLRSAIDTTTQLLEALAFAHARRVIHRDVKPDNILLFPGDLVRVADFGIATITLGTKHSVTIAGTQGYQAPEQALGHPSRASDVFSVGLILYRLLSGTLPRWPYEWPPPQLDRVRRKVPPSGVTLLRKALAQSQRRRYRDAAEMLRAVQGLRHQLDLSPLRGTPPEPRRRLDWRRLRDQELVRRTGRDLALDGRCLDCRSPVSALMAACPWCGRPRPAHQRSSAADRCRRCSGPLHPSWRYCPWCWGGKLRPATHRTTYEPRHAARCGSCRGALTRWMRYCPWCHAKVRRAWRIKSWPDRCGRCGWAVESRYFRYCPWCTHVL